MAKKRTLTWHAPTRRWKKQISNVVYYFGHGNSANDAKSYRAAERRYLEFLAKREQEQRVEIPLAQATVADVCEKYMSQLEQRYRGGDVCASHICRARNYLDCFLKFVGGKTPFNSVRELLLEDYRVKTLALPKSKVTGKPISPHTAKNRLVQVKALYVWAYEMAICELPRNLRRYCRVQLPPASPRVFTIEEIRQLWAAASPQLRCYIALALNCGFGQQDVSDLRASELHLAEGYIHRRRSKTGIESRHQLWPVTLTLIRQEMRPNAQGDSPIFKRPNGKAIVRSEWSEGKLRHSDAIKCLFWRLMRKAGVPNDRGFYTLRKTGATQIEKISPNVTEMYLAHAERGMKRNYAERDWTALARALGELERVFDLKIDAQPAAAASTQPA